MIYKMHKLLFTSTSTVTVHRLYECTYVHTRSSRVYEQHTQLVSLSKHLRLQVVSVALLQKIYMRMM